MTFYNLIKLQDQEETEEEEERKRGWNEDQRLKKMREKIRE